MAARDAVASVAHGKQASQLREQLQRLLPDQVGPAVEAVAEDANLKFRRWLDYGMLALEFREPISQLVRRVTGRPAPGPVASSPHTEHTRRPNRSTGITGRLWRHPILTAGLALGIGWAAYRLTETRRRKLQ